MAVIRCEARKPSGHLCNGFVADLSGEARVIRLVKHSGEKEPGHNVYPCRRCGALHEVAHEREPANAS